MPLLQHQAQFGLNPALDLGVSGAAVGLRQIGDDPDVGDWKEPGPATQRSLVPVVIDTRQQCDHVALVKRKLRRVLGFEVIQRLGAGPAYTQSTTTTQWKPTTTATVLGLKVIQRIRTGTAYTTK